MRKCYSSRALTFVGRMFEKSGINSSIQRFYILPGQSIQFQKCHKIKTLSHFMKSCEILSSCKVCSRGWKWKLYTLRQPVMLKMMMRDTRDMDDSGNERIVIMRISQMIIILRIFYKEWHCEFLDDFWHRKGVKGLVPSHRQWPTIDSRTVSHAAQHSTPRFLVRIILRMIPSSLSS